MMLSAINHCWMVDRALCLLRFTLYYPMLLLVIVYSFLRSLPQTADLFDFGAFVASARAAAMGQDPYGVYPFVSSSIFGEVPANFPNVNPPLSVLVFEPISRFEPVAAFHVGYFVSLSLYLLLVGLLFYLPRGKVNALHLLWALSLAGFWSGLFLGQIYVPLLLGCVAAWTFLRQGHSLAAGLFIGMIVAIKPNLVVWPVLLLIAGYRMAALSAFISAGLLSLAPLLVYGPGIYGSWLRLVASLATVASPEGYPVIASTANGSLLGLVERWGVQWLGVPLSALLLLAVAALVLYKRPQVLCVSGLAIVASLLTSPIAWVGYTILLVPVFLERRWTPVLGFAAALLVFPDTMVWLLSQQSWWHLLSFGSVYCIALLLVLFALGKEALASRQLRKKA